MGRNNDSRLWTQRCPTYYVCAKGAEGVGAAHVEVGAVESQEDFDVVEAISLGGKHERRGGCESAEINTNMEII